MTIKMPIRAAGNTAAPSRLRPTGTLKLKAKVASEEPAEAVPTATMLRVAFYVDGFNLYHAVDELAEPHLKWFDLWRVCEHVIDKQSERIVKVVWCSAEPDDASKLVRHRAYQKALESVGVQCVLGHFIDLPIKCRVCGKNRCRGCGDTYHIPNEKEGDVNVALHAVVGGIKDEYDVCYLVTADSDQVPTVKFIKELGKKIIVVAPPGRHHSFHLLSEVGSDNRNFTKTHIENSLFTGTAITKGGKHIVTRPPEYTPPARSVRGAKKPVKVVPRRSRR